MYMGYSGDKNLTIFWGNWAKIKSTNTTGGNRLKIMVRSDFLCIFKFGVKQFPPKLIVGPYSIWTPLTGILIVVPGPFSNKTISIANARAANRA